MQTASPGGHYADKLIFLLGYIFGYTIQSITAGKPQLTVFSSHQNHIHQAYKIFHYLDVFLNGEVKTLPHDVIKTPKEKIALSVQNNAELYYR